MIKRGFLSQRAQSGERTQRDDGRAVRRERTTGTKFARAAWMEMTF